MLKPWATVSSNPADEPIVFANKDGSKISHDALINDNIPEARDGYWYWNKPFYYNGHLQTALASQPLDNIDQVYYGRRLIYLDDGTLISLDYAIDPPSSKAEWEEEVKYAPRDDLPRYPTRTRYLRPEEVVKLDDPKITKPLVISIHGLTGGSHESYVRSTITELRKPEIDFDCVVITARGCNRTPITTPQLFNGAWTEDLRCVVDKIKSTQPGRPIYLVGYSLGASILANYLGQEGENSKIAGACVVANPWNLNACDQAMSKSLISRMIYLPTMAANLNRIMKNNGEVLLQSQLIREQWNKTNGPRAKTVAEFDDQFTGPIFGFESCYDYYRNASSINRLRCIRTPTLALAARDDPIAIDFPEFHVGMRRNPYMHDLSTDAGGHLGWFKADGTRWSSSIISRYFKALETTVDKTIPVYATPPKGGRWFEDGKFQMKLKPST